MTALRKLNLISRIAPTPSGFLHIGNAYNFLLTYLLTKANNGYLHLRIDDYDLSRYRKKYVQNIFDVIEFLGIEYNAGAKSVDEFENKFSFKLRLNEYEKNLQNLKNTYYCSCTKTTQNAYKNGVYQGLCKNRKLNFQKDKTALRLDTKSEVLMGDFVIYKKDKTPSYNYASVIDDERLGVNFIVRGDDLKQCSQAQIYIAKMLGFKLQNAKIIHHKLLLKDGKKLSKSANAPAIDFSLGAKFYYKILADELKLNPKSAQSLDSLLDEIIDKNLHKLHEI